MRFGILVFGEYIFFPGQYIETSLIYSQDIPGGKDADILYYPGVIVGHAVALFGNIKSKIYKYPSIYARKNPPGILNNSLNKFINVLLPVDIYCIKLTGAYALPATQTNRSVNKALALLF